MNGLLQAKLFESESAAVSDRGPEHTPQYAPISSVWEGSDGELLEQILSFYPSIPPEPILDSTYNRGRFWKGSSRRIVSMDIDPKFNPMIVGDNRKMEGIPDAAFGVVVYDPPHVGPQGRDKSRKKFDEDFGATVACGKEQGWKLSYLYPPFLQQAKRVLKPKGLLLAKITDMVNCHRSQWAHCDFMAMAGRGGFHRLRLDREGPHRAYGIDQVEDRAPCPEATLLLDYLP